MMLEKENERVRERRRERIPMKVCCGTGKGFTVLGGVVGRAICFNEKVIPVERKEAGCRLFAPGLSFSSVIKAAGLMCPHVCVQIVGVDCGRQDTKRAAGFAQTCTLKQSITKTS